MITYINYFYTMILTLKVRLLFLKALKQPITIHLIKITDVWERIIKINVCNCRNVLFYYLMFITKNK